MISPIYLGEPIFDGRTYTRVEPLAVARDRAWRTGQNWRKVLPNEGKVFAPRQPPFHRGQVFAFDTEPNTRNETERDLRLVADWAAVAEVLDFRDKGPEAARRALVEVGLEALVPGTTEVIAALPDGVCVVVRMERPPPTAQCSWRVSRAWTSCPCTPSTTRSLTAIGSVVASSLSQR